MLAALVLVMLTAPGFTIDDSQSSLGLQHVPSPVRSLLDRRFPGWRLAPTAPDVLAWFTQGLRGQRPQVALGDFDGNGQQDVAVQIVSGNGAQAEQRLLVYLRRGAGFASRMLARIPPDDSRYLQRMPKGTLGYSYTQRRSFRYHLDSVGVFHFEKGGSTFIFRGGRFYSEVTSD